jgi:hypothetical protein
MKETIQSTAEYLATMCLGNYGTYHNYGDKDLMNATLIFTHFLLDISYGQNKHLSKEKQMELGETIGAALREFIKVSCDKDMHVIAKGIYK